jgi:hypothetical protein
MSLLSSQISHFLAAPPPVDDVLAPRPEMDLGKTTTVEAHTGDEGLSRVHEVAQD